MKFQDELNKLLNTAVGFAGLALDSAKELIAKAQVRGEEAVSNIKVKNEELKHKIKENLDKVVTVTVCENSAPSQPSVDDILASIANLSDEDKAKVLESLK